MKHRLLTVYADLQCLPALVRRYGETLSAYRTKKCTRQKDALDRDRGRLAEYCLLDALHRYGADISTPLRIETDASGKPHLKDSSLWISLTHAGAFAAAAVSDTSVGVDLERLRPVTDSLARRICTKVEWEKKWLPSPTERTFRDLFSAKESIVKCSGTGLRDLFAADTVTARHVRQTFFEEYVLSVCADTTAEWEVFRCEAGDGS